MSPLVALIVAAAAAAAAAAGEVKVHYTTLERVYVRAGEADGLLLGAGMKVKRGGNAIGSCIVDSVSAHRASCPMAGGEIGDDVTYLKSAISEAPVATITAVEAEDAAPVQAALAAHEEALVVYAVQTPRRRFWRALGATLEHTSYVAFGSDNMERERLDLVVDGVALGFAGFRGYARASVIAWSNEADRLRLRPNEVLQLYVWQLEISSREIGQRYALALGRIQPQFAPGMAVIDGVQAGYRSRDGTFELGVVGGVMPDALRMVPDFNSYAVSAYYGHEMRGQLLRWLRHTGRLGLRGKNNVGFALEAEEAFDLRVAPWFDASAQARLTLRDTERYTPRLELLAVRAAVRPMQGLELAADVRYFGNMGADLDGFGAAYWMASDRLHVNVDARYRVLKWLAIGAEGGVAHDFASGIGRQYVGPVIGLPVLADGHLGLLAGYREELGWARGRFVYAQASLTFEPQLRTLLRASYSEDALAAAAADPSREIGVYASVEGRLVGVVRWFAQTSVRVPLGVLTIVPTRAIGLYARGGISATF